MLFNWVACEYCRLNWIEIFLCMQLLVHLIYVFTFLLLLTHGHIYDSKFIYSIVVPMGKLFTLYIKLEAVLHMAGKENMIRMFK